MNQCSDVRDRFSCRHLPAVSGPPGTARPWTGTALADGSVLLVGSFVKQFKGWEEEEEEEEEDDDVYNAYDAWLYDVTARSWISLGPAPGAPRNSFCCVPLASDGALLIGGYGPDTDQGSLNDMWFFDAAARKWSSLADAPWEGRWGHSCAALADGNILLTGGWSDFLGEGLGDTWLYDITTRSWSSAGDSPWPARWLHSCVALADGNALLTGGVPDMEYKPLNDAWLYDAATRSWSSLGIAPWPARQNHSCMPLIDGSILLARGKNYMDETLHDAWLFDIETRSWCMMSEPPAQLRSASDVVALEDGTLLLVGQEEAETDELRNAMWLLTVKRDVVITCEHFADEGTFGTVHCTTLSGVETVHSVPAGQTPYRPWLSTVVSAGLSTDVCVRLVNRDGDSLQ